MTEPLRDTLLGQLETAWALASYHLDGLTDEACLWRPAQQGLHVWPDGQGGWRADWPDHEGYDLGPPSIGWTTWHMVFWWSMALDHGFGDGSLTRETVEWSGGAGEVRARLNSLEGAWRGRLTSLSDAGLTEPGLSRWPFEARPLGAVFAWANIELTKNAAELGYGRFLYAVQKR